MPSMYRILILIAAIFTAAPYIAAEDWQRTSLSGTCCRTFYPDPTDARTVYGMSEDLWISKDAGISWRRLYISRLAFLPAEDHGWPILARISLSAPDVLWVAIRGALIQSKNEGKTWQQVALFPAQEVTDFEVDPAGTIHAGVVIPGRSVPPVVGAYMKRSGSAAWKKTLQVTGRLMDFAIDPDYSKRIYALHGKGLSLSTNAGKTWADFGSGVRNRGQELKFDPHNSNTLFARFGGLFKSTDRGFHWSSLNCQCYSTSYALDLIQPGVVYLTGQMAGVSGIFRSEDGGSTWEQLTTPPMAYLSPWVVSAGAGSLLSYSHYGSVIRSTNRGDSWNVTYRGTAGAIYEMRKGKSAELWAWGNALFKSGNSGLTWTAQTNAFPNDFQPITFDVSPVQPDFVAVFGHLLLGDRALPQLAISKNGGSTWSIHDTDIYAEDLVMDPLDADVVYARDHYRISKSTDSGNTWQSFPERFTGRALASFAVSASLPQRLYAGSTGYRLYVSADGGASWKYKTLPTLKKTFRNAVKKIVPANNGTVYALAPNQGVHRSTDQGETWQLFNKGLPILDSTGNFTSLELKFIALDPKNPSVVYTGGRSNADQQPQPPLFVSLDAGVTWQAVEHTSGLPPGFFPVNDLLFSRTAPFQVFLGSDTGVYTLRNR